MIEQRIARLRAFLQEHDADGVIIVQPENLRYFSAFTGGEGALVIGLDQAVLWTDSRYTEQAANQSGAWYDIKNHHNALSASIRSSLNDMEIGVAAYEENFLTHFMYENISDGALCGFLPCDLTSLRAVKEPYELKATRKASNIADRAFADLLPYIKPGVTEKELAARLESNMLLLGSEEKSFTTIVASGKRSAMPHGTASPKVVEAGDFVTFDFGAVWEGYIRISPGLSSSARRRRPRRISTISSWRARSWAYRSSRPAFPAAKSILPCATTSPAITSASISLIPWATVRAWRSTNNRSCRRVRQAYSKRI